MLYLTLYRDGTEEALPEGFAVSVEAHGCEDQREFGSCEEHGTQEQAAVVSLLEAALESLGYRAVVAELPLEAMKFSSYIRVGNCPGCHTPIEDCRCDADEHEEQDQEEEA